MHWQQSIASATSFSSLQLVLFPDILCSSVCQAALAAGLHCPNVYYCLFAYAHVMHLDIICMQKQRYKLLGHYTTPDTCQGYPIT